MKWEESHVITSATPRPKVGNVNVFGLSRILDITVPSTPIRPISNKRMKLVVLKCRQPSPHLLQVQRSDVNRLPKALSRILRNSLSRMGRLQ